MRSYACEFVPEGTYYAGYIGNLVKQGTRELSSYDKRGSLNKEFMPEVHKMLEGMLQKAQGTASSTYAAGTLSVIIPVWLEPGYVDLVRRETPVWEIMPKRAVRGKSIDFNQITAFGSAAFLPENSPLTEADDTYTRQTVAVKYCYAVGAVTGPLIAAATGYMDAMGNEVQRKTIALAMELERCLINGDVATYPNEFNGLIKTITSNTINKSGADITLNDIRTALRACRYAGTTPSTTLGGAMPNLIITDYETLDVVKAAMQDYLRYYDVEKEIAFGIQAVIFDGVAMLGSRYMPTTADAKRMLVINTAFLYLGVLQDMTYEELAHTHDSRKFSLKWYGALANEAEQFMCQIYGID